MYIHRLIWWTNVNCYVYIFGSFCIPNFPNVGGKCGIQIIISQYVISWFPFKVERHVLMTLNMLKWKNAMFKYKHHYQFFNFFFHIVLLQYNIDQCLHFSVSFYVIKTNRFCIILSNKFKWVFFFAQAGFEYFKEMKITI